MTPFEKTVEDAKEFRQMLRTGLRPDLMTAIDPLCKTAEQTFNGADLTPAEIIMGVLLFAATVVSTITGEMVEMGDETPQPIAFAGVTAIFHDMLQASLRESPAPSHATH